MFFGKKGLDLLMCIFSLIKDLGAVVIDLMVGCFIMLQIYRTIEFILYV